MFVPVLPGRWSGVKLVEDECEENEDYDAFGFAE